VTRHIKGFPLNLSRKHRVLPDVPVQPGSELQCQQCGSRNHHVRPYRPGQQPFCQPTCQEVRQRLAKEDAR
jgi:hypothetical protein